MKQICLSELNYCKLNCIVNGNMIEADKRLVPNNCISTLKERFNSKELTQKMKAVSEDLAEWYDYYCEG